MQKFTFAVVALFVLVGTSAAQTVPSAKKEKVTVSTPGYSGGTVKVEIEGGSDSYRLEAQNLAQEAIAKENERQAALLRDRVPAQTVSVVHQQQTVKVVIVPEPTYVVAPAYYPDLPRTVVVRRWVAHPTYKYSFYAANGRWYYWYQNSWVYRPAYQVVLAD